MLLGAPPISIEVPDTAVWVNGDGRRLGDVLLNLLSNAIKHARGTDRIDVRVRHDDDSVSVDVEDYGPGIPPDALPLIFDRHFQARRHMDDDPAASGLGLGLYIAHNVVLAHGGQIQVSSSMGWGTRFTVQLPRHAETAERT